jgi:hypothetical protein
MTYSMRHFLRTAMRRFRHISLRVVVAMAIVLFACALSFVMVVRSGWFQERVRERIIAEIENATGGRVEIGEFRFDWEHLTATVAPLVLHGAEGAGEPPLASIRSISVTLRIISPAGAQDRSLFCASRAALRANRLLSGRLEQSAFAAPAPDARLVGGFGQPGRAPV